MSLVSTGTLWYNPSYTFALHPLYFVRPPLFIYVTLMSPEVNRICDPGGVQCGQVMPCTAYSLQWCDGMVPWEMTRNVSHRSSHAPSGQAYVPRGYE